jgi:predicted DNA-binding transcriptional regulator YafY
MRKLQPLGLVLKAGIWYLVARANQQPRTYRVSNILEMSVSDERFKRPNDFDLVRFWTMSSRAYEVGLYRSEAVVRVSPSGVLKLDQLGSVVAQAAAETAALPDRHGWVRVVIPIESIEQAAADLIRLGTDAEVLEPLELRCRIAATAQALSRFYGNGKPRGMKVSYDCWPVDTVDAAAFLLAPRCEIAMSVSETREEATAVGV